MLLHAAAADSRLPKHLLDTADIAPHYTPVALVSVHVAPQWPPATAKRLATCWLAFRLSLLCTVHRLMDNRASPWDPTELLEEVLAEVLRQGEQVQWEGEGVRPLLVPGPQAQMKIAHHQDCMVDTLNTKLAHCDPSSH